MNRRLWLGIRVLIGVVAALVATSMWAPKAHHGSPYAGAIRELTLQQASAQVQGCYAVCNGGAYSGYCVEQNYDPLLGCKRSLPGGCLDLYDCGW